MNTGDIVEGEATFFDGLDNRRRSAKVTVGDALDISVGGAPMASWPLASIRRVDAPPGEFRIRSTAAPELARLVIADDPLLTAITARCARLDEAGGKGSWRRIVFWSAAAAASIVLMVVFLVPMIADRLAPLLPRAFETRLGDMVDNQFKTIFDAKVCRSEPGRAAFAKLMATIESQINLPTPVSGEVIASGVKNAVALPGGRVYLFRGLLDAAQTPDEIAGVLAHELGHVRHRDALRQLMRVGGSSFLIGLLFGDVSGSGAVIFAARQLMANAYSREVEYEADGVAIETMRALGRPVKPLGDLLTRVTGDDRGQSTLLTNHPLTAERMARFAAEDRGETGKQILDFGEWRALKAICSKG